VSDGVQLCITAVEDKPGFAQCEIGNDKYTQLKHSYTFSSAAANGSELIDGFISKAFNW
jgi:hypothetical protein